jgi:hypothetical protein
MASFVKLCLAISAKSAFLRALVLAPFYFLRFAFFALKEKSVLFCRYYPGYHGSTLPSLKEIWQNRENIFKKHVSDFDGIDLNEDKQLSLLKAFSEYYIDFKPKKTESSGQLYYYQNDMFGFNDGFILYCFLRHFQPNQVIEVGSGYSSGLMLDVCEELLPQTKLTFIDPYSTTISRILNKSPKQHSTLLKTEVQKVSLEKFRVLNSNDILFIDTSHVVKIGSDLSSLFFSIIPALNIGVIIHIHDIWYPWEYPEDMVQDGRAYNEVYFVRTFLQYNRAFEILFFGSYLETKYKNIIDKKMPGYFKNAGKSLWIRKIA